MIFNEVNKSHVDSLYNENLLVNLGSIKDSVRNPNNSGLPYGVGLKGGMIRDDDYIFVQFDGNLKPYINFEYASCDNPNKVLQIKIKINDEWVDVGAITGDKEITFDTGTKMNVYFDKEVIGSTGIDDKAGNIGIRFTSNGSQLGDYIEIYGLKLEAGLIPTPFNTDVESRALAIAKEIVENEIKGHDFNTNVVNVTPTGYDENVSFYGNGTAVIYDDRMGLITFGFRAKSKPAESVLFKISPSLFGWNSFKYISAIGAISSIRDNFNYPANSSFRLNSNGDVVNVTAVGTGDNQWKYFQITIPLARES